MWSASYSARYKRSDPAYLGLLDHSLDFCILEMPGPTGGRRVLQRVLDGGIRAALDQQARAIRASLPSGRDMQRRDPARTAEARAAVDIGAMIEEPRRCLRLTPRDRPVQRRTVVRLGV